MAIVYNATVKAARMTIVRDAIDGGSGPGKLQLFDFPGTTLLVEIPFEDPCGTVSGGVLTFDIPIIEPIALDTGTAAQAKLVTSADAVVGDGLTVGTVGTNVLLNSTQINAGEPVTITSASITHG
jgi:hypothetical protein